MCKLKKSLYGFKQAPKQWYQKFDQTLTSNCYIVNYSNSCVCSNFSGSDCVIICLYVDDILIFCTNVNVVNETNMFLSSKFDMKDLGEADDRTRPGYPSRVPRVVSPSGVPLYNS